MQAEAQMQAALAERTAAALAAGSNPNAVEGYVPRSSPDIAAVNNIDASFSTSPTAATDSVVVSSTSQKQAPSLMQEFPADSSAGPHDAPVREADQMAHDTDKHSKAKEGTSTGKHGQDRPGIFQTEDLDPVSDSASRSASLLEKEKGLAQSRRTFSGDTVEPDSLLPTMHGAAHSATEDPQQLAGSMPMSGVASSVAHAGTATEQNVAENDVSTSADPAMQPVLVCSLHLLQTGLPELRTQACISTMQCGKNPRMSSLDIPMLQSMTEWGTWKRCCVQSRCLR